MAMLGAAAALAAGAAATIVALQNKSCFSVADAALVPVKKRASTTTTLSGTALCRIAGMLTSGQRHLTLVGDMLMYGEEPGLAEGSIHLQSAQVSRNGVEITITKGGEVGMVITLDSEDEADFWAERMSSASMMSENLPKLFSMQRRQLQHLGQCNEAFENENKNMSKLLSLKRRECTEVERKAHHSAQEALELQQHVANYAELASKRESDLALLRQEIQEEKRRHQVDRWKIESKVASVSAEAASRRNEVAELSAEVINAESEAFEKEMQLEEMERAQQLKSEQIAEVQQRLMAMQQLLVQDEALRAVHDSRRRPRLSLPLQRELHFDLTP